MISVQLRGRLGNQLFQFAFAFATAKKLNTSFYLDSRYQKWLLSAYFAGAKHRFSWLDDYLFNIEGYRNFFRNHLSNLFYGKLKKYLNQAEFDVSDQNTPSNILSLLTDDTYYIGYFQSELFFKDCRNELKDIFSIRPQHKREFKEVFDSLPKNRHIVVIHVRRTDYLDYKIQLPLNYYHQALATIEKENFFCVFITDDVNYVESSFAQFEDKYIASGTEISDFQLMMHADTCIISNSTFSWWAAYLNIKESKVIAPNPWFPPGATYEAPVEVLPKNWTLISYNA